MSLDKAFNVIDGVLLIETLKDADDATLSTIVRLVHGFAYTIEKLRLDKGFKAILPPSNGQRRK